MFLRSIKLFTLLATLSFATLSFATAAPATRSRQAQNDAAAAAVRLFEAGRLQEARAAFEQILSREPQNAAAAFYLGRIAFAANNADEAVKWFERAVSLDATKSDYHHRLGQAYGRKARTGGLMSRAGFVKKVQAALLKAVELDAENLEARADLARFYNEVPAFLGGSEERAAEAVEFIKRRDARMGWLLAGELLAEKKKFAEAERAYLEAEKLQTSKFEATQKLGLLYQQAKEYDKAFAAFDRVLKVEPDNRAALYQIGRTAGMSGKNAERGLKAFEAVRPRLKPDEREAWIGFYWWRGKIYEAVGDVDRARAEYETLDKLSPGHPDTRAALERVKPRAAATSANKNRLPGLVSLEPSQFQSFDGEVIECEQGRLLVPERRAAKPGRLIELAFLRIKSTAREPQAPVIFLAGGPGGSGIQTGRLADYFQAVKAIRAVADVILLDQRGTGASVPNLGCHGTFGDLPATALRSRADAVQAFTTLARQCADRLRAAGVDFGGYTILESADDIEDLRRALKLKQVTLWGHSYGTQLAFATARRHAGGVARLVVMAVEGVANTHKLPSDVDRYFAQLAAMCKNDPRVGAQVPDLTRLMREVFDRLDREPVSVTVTHPATGAKRDLLVGGFGLRALVLQTAMNNTRNLPLVPLLFISLARGEAGVLSEMLGAAQPFRIPTADWFLIDGASGATAERRAQIRREAETALLGDVINFLTSDLSAVWQPQDLGDEFRRPVKSDVPALFISGTLDANTPPDRAEEVRQGFPHSAHIVVENAGHQDLLRAAGVIEAIATFVGGGRVKSQAFSLPAPEFIPPPTARQ
jgi:pimeloyl-ACP methyl ester carboxylesterase/cytochrome c-type biogenesis protein CcmH/NrfG